MLVEIDIRKSHSQAIQAFYDIHYPMLLKISIGYGRSETDADDDIQDFVIDKFCSRTAAEIIELTNTLGRIKRWYINSIIDKIRKEKKSKTQSISDSEAKNAAANIISIEDQLIIIKQKEIIKEAVIKRFPSPQDNEVFNFIIEGYENKEIVKITGIKYATVGNIRHKIKNYLIEIGMKDYLKEL